MDIFDKYTDPAFPNSFSGFSNFYKSLKAVNKDVKKKQVKDVLQKQEAFTLHQPVRKKYVRNKIIVPGIDDTWQADLVDMQAHSKENRGFKYILTVIDVFSKYAFAVPLKNKQGDTVTEAFKSIIRNRKPAKLHVDNGKEFYNQPFKALLAQNDIKMYSTFSEVKACVVERFNRTLKEKMWRMFTHRDNHIYYKDLQKLVDSYNNSVHSSISIRPKDVTSDNEDKIWFNLYGYQKNGFPKSKSAKIKFAVGDLVRITKYKYKFDKGYEANWSNEAFKISKIVAAPKTIYYLKDLDGEDVTGSFLEDELQVIQEKEFEPDQYVIEKILKERRVNGVVEKLIKFVGYPEPEWILASNITK